MQDEKINMMIEILKSLRSCATSDPPKKKVVFSKIPRDNLSPADCPQTEKVGTICPRNWDRGTKSIGVLVDYNFVPKNLEEAHDFVSHMKSRKFIKHAISVMMTQPDNHNFWFASRRYYTHVGGCKWNLTPAPVFFEQLKAKIWKFFWRTLSSYLSRKSCRKDLDNFVFHKLRHGRLFFTNSYLMEVLEPYKPLLRAAFNNRARSRVKVI